LAKPFGVRSIDKAENADRRCHTVSVTALDDSLADAVDAIACRLPRLRLRLRLRIVVLALIGIRIPVVVRIVRGRRYRRHTPAGIVTEQVVAVR
jgi:hypothetical protein